MSKTLGELSRSVINRNVKIQNIKHLSLPQVLKDECFENVTFDRSGDGTLQTPCACCHFSTHTFSFFNFQTFMNREDCLECLSLLTHCPILMELPMYAEWLKLPDRESLLKLYKTAKGENRHILEACLNTLRFDPSTGLGDAHEWIHKFLFYRFEHGWFRLSINYRTFTNFICLMKNKPIVVLPYGLVRHKDRDWDDEKHELHIMMVVKNNNLACLQDMDRLGIHLKASEIKTYHRNVRILNVKHFIATIDYLCSKSEDCLPIVPMIPHAFYWMFLLVPSGYLTRDYNCYQMKKCDIFENCVVRLDPLHQRINDDIVNLEKHIKQNGAFVYWLDGQVLDVKTNLPSFVTQFSKMEFIEWCLARGINTCMKLNGYTRFQHVWNPKRMFSDTIETIYLLEDDCQISQGPTIDYKVVA